MGARQLTEEEAAQVIPASGARMLTPEEAQQVIVNRITPPRGSSNYIPEGRQAFLDVQERNRRLGTAIDDVVRGIASGMTFGLADEAAAGMSSLTGIGGQGGDGSYEGNLEAERIRDESVSPWVRIPSEIAGGILTGTGLARGGMTLLNAARPTVGGMALRGAGEGAAYGAAYGFGSGEGAEDRLTNAIYGAGVGGVGGGLVGGVSGLLNRPVAQATPQALREQASQAYQVADDAGVVLTGSSLRGLVDDIQSTLTEQGFDDVLHPRIMAAFNRIKRDSEAGNITLRGVEILRRVARNASSSNQADERRLGMLLIDDIDDYIARIGPDDVIMGNADDAIPALQQARDLYARSSKAQTIEDLIESARLRSSQFSGSGFENALRTEFRNLARNPKRMRLFTEEERAAIRRVTEGGTVANALRRLGVLAPTGVVSQALGAGMGAYIGGPVGAAAFPAVGAAARAGATGLTSRAAQEALNTMLRTGPRVRPPLTPTREMLTRAGLLSGAIEGPELRGLVP